MKTKAKETTKSEPKRGILKRSFNDRHPLVVPALTMGFLLFATVFGFVMFGGQVVQPEDTKIVNFSSDGKTQSIVTRAKNVKEFLERSNIQIAQGDVVEPAIDTEIKSQKFSVNLYKAKPVTIVDEKGKKSVVKTADTIPEVVAKKAGYNLYPEDIVKVVEPDKSLENGIIVKEINIDRATLIKMNLFGSNFEIRTHAKTVADLAKERGIDFNDSSVLPAPTTPLKDNQVVFITQPGKQLVTAEEDLPFEEETVEDKTLTAGSSEVRQEGVAGKRVVVYEVLPDGARNVLQEIVLVKPTNKVTAKGRKPSTPNISVAADKANLMSQAGIPADQHASVDYIISRESGWRPGATNAGGCIGLGQRCNPSVLINACPNWETDAVCQLQHFNGYAVGRYGSWNEAYAFWSVNHWW